MVWYILAFVILLIILILALPVHVVVKWNEDVSAYLYFMAIKIKIYPVKNKKKNSETEKKDKGEHKQKRSNNKVVRKSPEEMIDKLVDSVHRYGPGAKIILNNIKVYLLEIYWKICADDACECAIRYGNICALLSSATALFQNMLKIRKSKLRVFPDFSGEKEEFNLSADFSFNPIIVFIGLVKIAIQYYKLQTNNKRRI